MVRAGHPSERVALHPGRRVFRAEQTPAFAREFRASRPRRAQAMHEKRLGLLLAFQQVEAEDAAVVDVDGAGGDRRGGRFPPRSFPRRKSRPPAAARWPRPGAGRAARRPVSRPGSCECATAQATSAATAKKRPVHGQHLTECLGKAAGRRPPAPARRPACNRSTMGFNKLGSATRWKSDSVLLQSRRTERWRCACPRPD